MPKRDARPLEGPTHHRKNKRDQARCLPRARSNSVATTKTLKRQEKQCPLDARKPNCQVHAKTSLEKLARGRKALICHREQ
ncbi:hypothetical protein NDU88_000822 [Pleurodeles waltl]|uniref:Uncharacterized protein n=1 Tax=Pleurodeles waltl TaxID=8319 RepID=A0AAV7N924_PLEWA|nr:hypothetical protein NDU88_000822 [Pleurodeles waltl]